MSLKTKTATLIGIVFFTILGASYFLFARLESDLTSGLGTVYVEQQVRYNRERILHPLMRELALAQKLAGSTAVQAWAKDEAEPGLRAAALRELDDYRRFFSDRSFFFVIDGSKHYYYNDRDNQYAGNELRYTLDPKDPENAWYFRTLESGEPYKLNVDYDEKLQVTKVWMNIVVHDGGRALGVIGTGLDLSEFLSAVVSTDQPGITNMFVDGNGAIQAHDRVDLIDFRSIAKDPNQRKTIFHLLNESGQERLQASMEKLLVASDADVDILRVDVAGKHYLLGLTYLREIGWYNITLMDTQLMIGAQRFVPFAVLWLLALVVLTFSLALLLNTLVFKRIERLERSMQEFAQGALPPSQSRTRGDEMGRLEEGFRQMAQSVREHTVELETRVEERTHELAEKNETLELALSEIQTLSGLLPTCMYCKNIRDEAGTWLRMEEYISQRSEAQFSHGICPSCEHKAFAEDDEH